MATKQSAASAAKTANKAQTVAKVQAEEIFEKSIEQAQQVANEVPALMRDAAEKAVAKSKEAYETIRKEAEENTAAVEDSVAQLSSGLRELNLKALNAAEQNALAGFDFFKKVIEAKTVAEVVQLQSAFVRDRFEAATSVSKDLQESAKKVVENSSAPIRVKVEKTLQYRA